MKTQPQSKACGPEIQIEIKYPMNAYEVTLHVTPHANGEAHITITGDPPPNVYIPDEQEIAAVKSVRGTCRVITEVLKHLGAPDLVLGYIVKPGYIPDKDELNARTLMYPCGKPRGHHWHPIKTDFVTGKAIPEQILETLGDHSQKDLSKLIYNAVKHIWPKDVQ